MKTPEKVAWVLLIVAVVLHYQKHNVGFSKPPISEPGKFVLFLEDRDTPLSKSQEDIPQSADVRDYLNQHCSAHDQQPDWRVWDAQTDISLQPQYWQQLVQACKAANPPTIAIVNGRKWTIQPLPANEEDTLALLKKYLE